MPIDPNRVKWDQPPTNEIQWDDSPTQQEVPMAVSHAPVQPEEPNAVQQALRISAPYYRAILEGGGAGAGGVIGSATSPIVGTVAGGTLGYGIGKRSADALDEYAGIKPEPTVKELATQTAKDLKTGAMYEMGGMAAVPVFMGAVKGGKFVFDQVLDPAISAFTTRGAQKTAGEHLIAHTSAGDIFARNADEAREIERQIPGLKFSQGQLTGDPGVIKLERTQVRAPGPAAGIHANRVAENNIALRNYYQKNFGTEEGIDDLVTFLESEGANLRNTADHAVNRVQGMAEALPSSNVETTGQRIVDTLSDARSTVKTQSDDLYEKVPDDLEIDIDKMIGDFKRISTPRIPGERKKNIPDLLKRVVEAVNPSKKGRIIVNAPLSNSDKLPKTISLKNLRGIRSELLDEARDASSGLKPNRRRAKRLYEAVDSIETAIANAEGSEGASEALKIANKYFKEEYHNVFRSGTVGDILTRGTRGESSKIPIGQIPSKIWNTRNLSAATDFMKATHEARNIMRDHAAYDLMQNVTNADGAIVPGKLQGWLAKNRQLLEKFGITDEFKKLSEAQKIADFAKTASDDFEKSVAGRILNTDPENAVATALSGKDAGKKAKQLMVIVGKDPAAKRGLQKAFTDHIVQKIQTTAKDVSGNPTVSIANFNKLLDKYAPVMREIYKGEPKKVEALKTMKRAYEIASRNTRSPIGGGSDSAENLLTRIGETNFLSRTAYIVKSLFRWLSAPGRKQADEMLTKALFDPDYAEEILKIARSKVPNEQLLDTVNGKLISMEQSRRGRIGQGFVGLSAATGDGK